MSYFLRSFIKQQILFLMIAFFAVFLSRIVNNDLSFAFNIQNSLLYSFIQYFISVLIVFSFINLIYFGGVSKSMLKKTGWLLIK